MCYPCLGTCVTHVSGPYSEEGWLRHQENFGAAHLSAADGVVAHKSHSGMSDHPVRSNKEASRHFLYVASTPPHEEGTTLGQKVFSKKQAMTPLCLCGFERISRVS